MKKIIILTVLVFSIGNGHTAWAQSRAKIRKGDKEFGNYLYQDAINTYESIRKKDAHIYRKLAEASLLTGDSKNAEKYYAKLYATGQADTTDLYNYAEALKMNSKYAEAISMMETYNNSVSGDGRVSDHLKDKNYYTSLAEDKGQFAIHNLSLNTNESDFGTAYYQDKVVFTSSRPKLSFTNYEYNWNKKNYLKLYSFEPKGNDKIKVRKIKLMRSKGGLNKRFHEGPATFSADGNLMIFTRDRYSSKKELNSEGIRVLELWSCTRNEKGRWSKPAPLSFNNKDYNVGHATLSADGNTLYFVSDMPGGKGKTDIYYAVKNADGSWSTPVNAGDKINTEGREMFPFMHPDGILFFASDGHAGLGGLDVFMAPAKNNTFGTSKNVGATINSNQDDFAFILDKEMKSGYFSSSREGGKGSDDIYAFDLLIPFKLSKKIEGYTVDKNNPSVILPGTVVNLYDANNNIVGTVQSDKNGYYSFEAEPDNEYTLTGSYEKYTDGKNTASTQTADDLIKADLLLERIPQFSLSCFVSDNKSGIPLENTHIVIKDKTSGEVLADVTTDKDGYWKKSMDQLKLNDQLSYTIALSHDGYLNKNLDFNYTVNKEGEIKVHQTLDLTLGKLEVGQDIGKLINIKPIYFDLGKYAIRKDAAIELDKIVAIMTEYPNMVIELGSHTDCRSSIASNLKLSDNRAKASANYIISKGIDKSRIYGKGYGESKLVNGCACEGSVKSNCSEEEHQQNRRTEFIIIKM